MDAEHSEFPGLRYSELAGQPPTPSGSPRGSDASVPIFFGSEIGGGSGDYGRSCDHIKVPVSPMETVKPAGGLRRAFSKANVIPRETRARYPAPPVGMHGIFEHWKTTWLIVDLMGNKSELSADKRAIIQKFKLGVPIRDMRLLDPNLLTSETGKILVRDNAILVSIEHVRLIITAELAIIPQTGFDHNPVNKRFVELLEEALAQWRHECSNNTVPEMLSTNGEESESEEWLNQHQVPPLPFELQVLEVALGDVCALCAHLVKELESVSHPALDALTKHVSKHNLERVRKVKTRHQRLQTRVSTVREELERFLEDDDDMSKMCLTRKKELEQAPTVHQATSGQLATPFSASMRRQHSLHVQSTSLPTPRGPQAPPSPFANVPDNPDGGLAVAAPAEDEADFIDAVENLLESYFMQVDASYDKLVNIAEYIKDTEEYINIELDSQRNRLIRLEIILTAGTFSIALWSLVAGLFGENLILPWGLATSKQGFIWVNVVTCVVCLAFFYSILAYLRYKRLL